MQPYQQRVVDEKNELDKKIQALNAFILGQMFVSLSEDEKRDLVLQSNVMSSYSLILESRILRFK